MTTSGKSLCLQLYALIVINTYFEYLIFSEWMAVKLEAMLISNQCLSKFMIFLQFLFKVLLLVVKLAFV